MIIYDVYLADLPLLKNSHVQGGTRPVIIMSQGQESDTTVTVIPMTSRLEKRYKPEHVLVIGAGLNQQSLALVDQMQTVDKSILRHYIGYIDNICDQRNINRACLQHLGLLQQTVFI